MINIRKVVPNLTWEQNNRLIYACLIYLDIPNGILASSRSLLTLEPLLSKITDGHAHFNKWLPQAFGLMAEYQVASQNVWCRVRLNGVNQGLGNYLLLYSPVSRAIEQLSQKALALKPENVLVAEDELLAADILSANGNVKVAHAGLP